MNGKIKLAVWALVLVVVIGGSAAAYKLLAGGQSPETRLVQDKGEPVGETGAGESSSGASERPEIPAPDFTVVDADGVEVKLSDLTGEKPVILNFWASWCPPCKSEMPDFNRVYEEVGDEVNFAMVDLVDGFGQETREKGAKYIAEQGFTFPVYYDVNQEAAQKYGISSIPTTYFIDKNGNLITMASGAIDEETLRYGVDLLTGKVTE